MGNPVEPAKLRTLRLLLRTWRPQDRAPFAALNADPQVMAHFPNPLSRAESDLMVDRMEAQLRLQRWGLWAVEITDTGEFAGFVGLNRPSFTARFTPAVEVGWRLAHRHWHHGYASEAARAALDYGFESLHLDEIVSFTSTSNLRSQHVMERLGMHRDPADDFDHPRLPPDHRLSRQVLYRLSSSTWSARSAPDRS
ncbi:MAG: GNAT family N-acetyltransferase [Candidatus Dormiibacterota bacterium]